MPFPNFHAARMIDPVKFNKESFRTKNITDGIDIIIGKLKDGDGSMVTQSYRFDKTKFTVDQAKAWLKKEDLKPILFEPASEEAKEDLKEEILETIDIKGKEICAIGTFNGLKITEKTLDEFVKNFNDLKDRGGVPMFLGHTTDHTDTKSLAAGWLVNLRRVGNKLVTDISDVPKIVAKFIKTKGFRNVSIEFFKNWTDGETGRKYKNVLTALALMGIARPAVPGLKDFDVSFSKEEDGERIKINMEEYEMELEKKLELSDTKIRNLETEKTEFSKKIEGLETEKVAAIEELQQLKETQKIKELIAFVEKNSSEETMKILPAEKDRVSRILKALDNEKISFKEDEIELTVQAEFKSFIEGLENRVSFETKSEQPKIDKVSKKNHEEQLDYYAEQIVKKEECEYTEALEKVLVLHPELDKEDN